MKILLSGSTGYIGNFLYKALCKSHKVYTLNRKKKDEDENSIILDFKNDLVVDNLPKEVDVILHMAQSGYYKQFPEQAMDIFKVNVASTAFLLDYASKINVKQFILISSGAVYEPFHGVLKENIPLLPKSYYALSKYMSELLANCYSNQFKICNLRLFFVYGPHQRDRLIPNIIQKIKDGQPVGLADGKDGMTITPTYIDDVIKVINSAIESNWHGTINLASPERITIRRISELISGFLKKPLMFEQIKENKNNAIDIIPELECLKNFYSDSFISFEEGLNRMFSEDPF